MTPNEKAILDKLESMPIEEARAAIHTGVFGGQIGSPAHGFCVSWLDGKDASERISRESESLSISREALSISRKALRNSERANTIATIAMILSASATLFTIITWYLVK